MRPSPPLAAKVSIYAYLFKNLCAPNRAPSSTGTPNVWPGRLRVNVWTPASHQQAGCFRAVSPRRPRCLPHVFNKLLITYTPPQRSVSALNVHCSPTNRPGKTEQHRAKSLGGTRVHGDIPTPEGLGCTPQSRSQRSRIRHVRLQRAWALDSRLATWLRIRAATSAALSTANAWVPPASTCKCERGNKRCKCSPSVTGLMGSQSPQMSKVGCSMSGNCSSKFGRAAYNHAAAS
jgi:hypothetical protein